MMYAVDIFWIVWYTAISWLTTSIRSPLVAFAAAIETVNSIAVAHAEFLRSNDG
jgi:hypothetical protein